MSKTYDKIEDCLKSIRKVTDFVPKVAIVLGSGLGDYADGIEVVAEIDYSEIKGFPVSTVPGHAGKFIFVDSVPVVCMKAEFIIMKDMIFPMSFYRQD